MIVQLAKLAGARVLVRFPLRKRRSWPASTAPTSMILYTQTDFLDEVKRITGGKGVDVVYDSVGHTTFHKSLDCLRPRGMMVSFGQSSGPVGPSIPWSLSQKGSLFLTRPSLGNYISDPKDLEWRASDFSMAATGELKLHIQKAYPLADAAQAHRDLEGRKTTGKLLLMP